MNGVNKVILLGNVGKPPEVRYFESGRAMASFSLATTETFKDKSGNRVKHTEWHNLVIWNKGLVDVVEEYVKKGTPLYVEGKIRTRSYEDQQKKQRFITEIHVENIRLLSLGNEQQASENKDVDENFGENGQNDLNLDKSADDLPF